MQIEKRKIVTVEVDDEQVYEDLTPEQREAANAIQVDGVEFGDNDSLEIYFDTPLEGAFKAFLFRDDGVVIANIDRQGSTLNFVTTGDEVIAGGVKLSDIEPALLAIGSEAYYG